MTAERKPRPIGPRAVAEPVEQEAGAEATFSLEGFLAGLSAGDLMDLDEASGGAVARMTAGGEEVEVTLKLLFAVAWIAKRREEPRLTFRQVRAMRPDELAGILNSLGDSGVPKAGSAPAS
jgi:hypothetical protein